MKNSREVNNGLLVSALKAQIIWLLSAVILLLVFCSVAYTVEDPDSLTKPLALCALYISSLIAGAASTRISKDGIASGLICGVVIFLIIMCIAALPLPDSEFEMPGSLLYSAAVIPASAVGSLIGKKKSTQGKNIHNRKRLR